MFVSKMFEHFLKIFSFLVYIFFLVSEKFIENWGDDVTKITKKGQCEAINEVFKANAHPSA